MVQCRLDFFLVSQSIVGNITLADICPGYNTDNSMITLDLSLHANRRGPGFVKLNTSFLTILNMLILLKGQSHAILVHFKNQIYVLTPTNNGLVLLPKTILLH